MNERTNGRLHEANTINIPKINIPTLALCGNQSVKVVEERWASTASWESNRTLGLRDVAPHLFHALTSYAVSCTTSV